MRLAHLKLCNTPLLLALLTSGLLAGCGGGDSSPQNDPVTPCANPSGIPDASFNISRPFINIGESTLLSWSSPDATQVSIEPEIGVVANSGELSVSPTQTTEYQLLAESGTDCNVLNEVVTVRAEAGISIQANTLTGSAPLSVRFTPQVDSRTAINRYYWDFEGDGGPVDGGLGVEELGFDRLNLNGLGTRDYDVVGRDIVHIFEVPGTYTVRARVWDVENNQAEAMLDITVGNSPPQATVRANPTSGGVPLESTLEIVEATDNEGISRVEWDFEGDGEFDELVEFDPPLTRITSRNASVEHSYATVGSFRPVIRVTDVSGAFVDLNPLNLQVNPVAEAIPLVTMAATPNEGTAPLQVRFSSRTTGFRNFSYAWDFDGDGTIDNNTDALPTVVYNRAGTFYPTVTVTAEDGEVGRDIMAIRVEADHDIAIADATIDPEQDESTDIKLTVAGAAPLQLVVENAGGTTVNTLRDWAEAENGEYTFSWDGRDGTGNVLPPGDYYVVARYRVDGREETLDLRTSTGGKIFYPNDGSVGDTCQSGVECGELTITGTTGSGGRSMAPFGETPVTFAFDLPQNAKMSAYITVRGSENFSPATFFRSVNLPQGDYSIVWHADGTDGKILPSRSQRRGYVPAIFGLSASDNAIFLSHLTRLSDFSLTPRIFVPTKTASETVAEMQFDLNRSADILMRIDSVDAGTEVHRQVFAGVPAGSDVLLSWNGKINDTDFVAPGRYRITLTAQDEYGQTSLPVSALQRIRY